MSTVIKIVGQITLKALTDVKSTTYYYLLQSSMASAPTKPITNPPTGGWSITEPGFFSYVPTQDATIVSNKDYYIRSGTGTEQDPHVYTKVTTPVAADINTYYEKIYGDTKSLYVTVQTLYTDNTFEYSEPSLSSSYEAAKEAYNRAKTALDLAGDTNQYFWTLSSAYSTNVPAGVYVTHIPQNQFKSSPAQGNVLVQNTGLTIRNGAVALASLTGSALNFYSPTTHNAAMQLSGQALNFYNPNNDRLSLSLNSNGLNFYGSSIVNPDASLTTTGLVLSKGGIQTGTSGQNGFVYLSSEDYQRKDATHSGTTINGHTPTAAGTDDKTIDDPAWREIIGTKFGVDSEGNLYANNANLSNATVEGAITATSLTIGSGSDSYNAINAMNAAGYTIEIINDITAAPDNVVINDNSTYLYPIMYHNGIKVENADIINTQYIWYRGSDVIGIQGDSSNGGMVADYGYTYRVAYSFDDGEVGQAPSVQQVLVDPSKYITRISDTGITIHPEDTSNNNYIQLDGTALTIVKNGTTIATYGSTITIGANSASRVVIDTNGLTIYKGVNDVAQFGTTARIGQENNSRFLINTNSLQAYNSLNQKYFEVSENGLTWGSNVAATVAQVEAAGQASKYITKINNQGVKVHAYNDSTQTADELNYLSITNNGINIYQSNGDVTPVAVNIAQFGTNGARIGKEYDSTSNNNESHLEFDYHSMQMIDKEGQTYFHVSDLRDRNGMATIIDIFKGDGTTTEFDLSVGRYAVDSIISVTINNIEISAYTLDDYEIIFDTPPANFSTIKVTYNTTSTKIKAYTFGKRKTGTIGSMSVAEGYNTLSSGWYSHAEGYGTEATAAEAHAEGWESKAEGVSSHAEGSSAKATGAHSHAEGEITRASGKNSHAEGYGTKASNTASHAEGYYTEATGYASHAGGANTVAQRYAQTVIGEYNISDTYRDPSSPSEFSDEASRGKYTFIIGNGEIVEEEPIGNIIPTSIHYSNAFTVDWSGNIQYAGSSTKMSDKRLKEHKSYLSTDAIQFVQKLKPAYFEKDNQFHTGFYAQDVEEIDPWNCMTGEMNGYKTLGYDEIIAPLVTYCQYLEKRIAELESQFEGGID